jgi:hypothetical protein
MDEWGVAREDDEVGGPVFLPTNRFRGFEALDLPPDTGSMVLVAIFDVEASVPWSLGFSILS